MFSIKEKSENGFGKIILTDDTSGTFAEIIPGCSAMLHSFFVNKNGTPFNVISSYASMEDFTNYIKEKGFRGCKLSPFVCRIVKSKYNFAGTEYHLKKSQPAEHALHGELYDKAFTVIEKNAHEKYAEVRMIYSFNKEDPGYPFSYDCIVTWRLESNNILRVTTQCINKDEGLIPMVDGWHPYFTLGESIDDLHLEFQSMEMLEFNEDLVPTGKFIEYDRFNSLQKFGTTVLDNSFTLNLKTCQPMCVLRSVENKIQVEFHPDNSYPYLQIYTPEDRKSIAIENISGAPNAFNNGMGLKILEPGQSAVYSVAYKITHW